jgi:CubicO group peptidase (beta-lactamase class C family)
VSDPTPDDSKSTAVRKYLTGLMEARSIPGLQIAIVRNGAIEMLDMMGLANIEHQVPVMRESIFSINSMAKAFTGIAVMQLVEDGKLDLEAPISHYLDGLPEGWKPIRVRQLATLNAGVPEMMVYTAQSNVALLGDGSEDGAWQAAYSAPMEYPTGQGYAYTQTNYALLGRIIEQLSGTSFAEFVARRQFAIAGMPHTHFFTDQDIVANRANTYMSISVDGDPAGKITNSHLNWPRVLWPAAGLHSTAVDIANWLVALQRGALLAQASSIEMLHTAPPLHDGRPGVWGIGWHIGRSAAGRVPAPGGGAKAQVVLYPDGLAVILLTNLLGAFPEHLAPVSANEIDLSFIDPIAKLYTSW